MMQDIRRICETPTAEDRALFPEIAGSRDWRNVLKDAWANYRDESFIQQFLSPEVIRRFRMFSLDDEAAEPFYVVSGIHDERGYRAVREKLARSRDISISDPDIQVVDVDLLRDRVLHLKHFERAGIPLEPAAREATLAHLKSLWGHPVVME